jgi:signal transduction histidine kinase
MPIVRADGSFFGTLCAIDPEPRRLRNPETMGMFRLFADLIAAQLDAQERLSLSERALGEEREVAALREQFIAVLGHDLRNPLAALMAGTNRLMRDPANDEARTLLTLMKSSALRMNTIIGNLLDFARGRLGGGMGLDITNTGSLEDLLVQVVDEIRAVAPQAIELRLALEQEVPCDHQRMGQMLSNLLGNAVMHGDPAFPVTVEARAGAGRFELAVSNRGPAIPPERLASLFQPFWRDEAAPSRQGLGLGLYIASEIAQAHGGALTATSAPNETRFSFVMPFA